MFDPLTGLKIPGATAFPAFTDGTTLVHFHDGHLGSTTDVVGIADRSTQKLHITRADGKSVEAYTYSGFRGVDQSVMVSVREGLQAPLTGAIGGAAFVAGAAVFDSGDTNVETSQNSRLTNKPETKIATKVTVTKHNHGGGE